MNQHSTITGRSLVYYRLVALWVVAEALLGGIIHGLKIPVSGLVVGGCAVICIGLIAWYVPARGVILKATLVVAIFKMMLSPQAPAAAYIAVFFQGAFGELLFLNRRFFRLSCMLLAVLAMLESALQRILLLTIVYGNDLWKVINDFINKLTRQTVPANYSLLIAGVYVLVHLVAGLLIGWWVAGLPQRIARWSKSGKHRIIVEHASPVVPANHLHRRKWVKKGLFIVWIILVLLYVQSFAGIGAPLLPSSVILRLLFRSVIIVLTWYFLVGPLLKRWLHRWLQKKKAGSQQDVAQVLQLLPATQALVVQSWRQSAGKRGWKKIKTCIQTILVNALNPVQPAPVVILTGAIQTGKTSALFRWSEGRSNVFGILSPVVNGKRVFMDLHTREQFPMEAAAGEPGVLSIGRYMFSQQAFDKAEQVIQSAMQQPGWLVIDEIGPLELEQKGFYSVLKAIVQHPPAGQTIILVVREGLVERVKEMFGLQDAIVVHDLAGLPGPPY